MQVSNMVLALRSPAKDLCASRCRHPNAWTMSFTPKEKPYFSQFPPFKNCGPLSDWIVLCERADRLCVSQSPPGAELGSSGCQRRWNVRPLTGILTLRHFDKSDRCFLSGDWEWQERGSWIHNVVGCGRTTPKQTAAAFLCAPPGSYMFHLFLAMRGETRILELTRVETQSRTKWLGEVRTSGMQCTDKRLDVAICCLCHWGLTIIHVVQIV